MEDDKKNKYGIVPFAGTNFGNWLFRLETVLNENDLLEEIDSTIKKKKEEENSAKEKKCLSIIVQSIADSHLELVKDLRSPKEIIEKLKRTFQLTGIASQLLARKKLLTIKYNEKNSLSEFFLEFDKCIRLLRESGANPAEEELICYLLLAMPAAYGHLVSAIETVSSGQLNMEFVRRRLLDEETKKKGLIEAKAGL